VRKNGFFSALKAVACDTRRLVRLDLQLARAEFRARARNVGIGIGLVVAALLVAPFALAALIAAMILALALVVPGWAAALIVAFFLVAIVGAIVGVGVMLVRNAMPPVPREAVDQTKEDLRWLTKRLKSALK
jgi:uncharacterized membrane protein YgaE (UPF0421/DUF939 family)